MADSENSAVEDCERDEKFCESYAGSSELWEQRGGFDAVTKRKIVPPCH